MRFYHTSCELRVYEFFKDAEYLNKEYVYPRITIVETGLQHRACCAQSRKMRSLLAPGDIFNINTQKLITLKQSVIMLPQVNYNVITSKTRKYKYWLYSRCTFCGWRLLFYIKSQGTDHRILHKSFRFAYIFIINTSYVYSEISYITTKLGMLNTIYLTLNIECVRKFLFWSKDVSNFSEDPARS